ncbi:MAG: thermonuclease family protein [Candidatus Schekmanbacteria bacterium]|nr:thermonuclease family protein [Candidatus Schekmanbacteria bacterium]
MRQASAIIALAACAACAACDSGGSSAPELADGVYEVERVIDGDTVVLAGGTHVRLIGVDTPEVGDCLAAEATALTRALVDHQHVYVDICEDEPEDRYGRTLAFVFSGTAHVNARLLESGLAELLYLSPCQSYVQAFAALEAQAREAGLGIWAQCPPP